MDPPKIPGPYLVTSAMKARYLEGWQDGLAGRPHAYKTEDTADVIKRRFGTAQFEAYSAGYEAGVNARSDQPSSADG